MERERAKSGGAGRRTLCSCLHYRIKISFAQGAAWRDGRPLHDAHKAKRVRTGQRSLATLVHGVQANAAQLL